MLGRTVREDNMGALEEWLTTAPPDGELSTVKKFDKGGSTSGVSHYDNQM